MTFLWVNKLHLFLRANVIVDGSSVMDFVGLYLSLFTSGTSLYMRLWLFIRLLVKNNSPELIAY